MEVDRKRGGGKIKAGNQVVLRWGGKGSPFRNKSNLENK